MSFDSLLIDLYQDPQTFLTTFYRFTEEGIQTRYLSDDLCPFLSSEKRESPEKILLSTDSRGETNRYRIFLPSDTGLNPYILKTIAVNRLSIDYQTGLSEGIKQLGKNIFDAIEKGGVLCSSRFAQLEKIYVGCDKFSIEILIAAFLQNLMSDFPLQTYLNYYQASLCHQINLIPAFGPEYTGIFLREEADLGRLDKFSRKIGQGIYHQWERKILVDSSEELIDVIKPSVIVEILKQLILTLYHLSHRGGFTHGHLLIEKILLSSSPAKGLYFSIPLNLPFTVKISDYREVSLDLPLGPEEKIHHFYYRHPVTDIYLRVPRTPYQFITGKEKENGKEKEYFVLPLYFTAEKYQRLRFMGLPFYSSFDLYTLLVSMMMTPIFYYSILNHPFLEKLWNSLWFLRDLQVINQRLRFFLRKNKSPTMENVIEFLSKTRLKCDLFSDLIEILTSEINPSF